MQRHRIWIIGAALALLGAAIPASSFAYGCTTQNIGSFSNTSCDDGTRATTQYIGSTAYTSGTDPYGDTYRSTTQYIGNTANTSGPGWTGPNYSNSYGSGPYGY